MVKGGTIVAATGAIIISSVIAGGLIAQKQAKTTSYSLSLSASSVRVYTDQKVMLTASLHETSPENKPIEGVDIQILNETTGTVLISGTSGSNGALFYTAQFSEPGTYKISATASSPLFATGTEKTGEMTSGAITIFVVKQPLPPGSGLEYSLVLTASETNISAGQTVLLTAHLGLLEPHIENIPDAPITLIENSTSAEGSTKTNADGNALFSIEFSDPGTYTLQAVYFPEGQNIIKSNPVEISVAPQAEGYSNVDNILREFYMPPEGERP